MGLSSFFKNLFGSAKETASELADKAEAEIFAKLTRGAIRN